MASIAGAAPEQKPGYQECPVPAEPHHMTMTPQVAKHFVGPEVRQYVARLATARRRSNQAFVDEPHEYSDVVSAGKGAVPFLLRELRNEDPARRGAAFMAIAFVTNKGFGSNNPDPSLAVPDVGQYEEWWDQNKGKSRVQWLIDDVASEDLGRAEMAIQRLAVEGDATAVPALRTALSKDRLRPYAAEALAELGDKQAVPDVIDTHLNREEMWVRKEGICLLIRLTGKSFDFDPNGTPESRKAAIDRWEVWWQTEGKSQH